MGLQRFTSIPDILLIFAFAAVLGRGITTVILILGLVGWTGMYRLVRAEYIKHHNREYVRAAEAIGTSHLSRMFVHILPNVSHVVLVRMSLYVVGFIKAEVILSFLGLGVLVDQVSWGTMLSEAQAELVLGHWWQTVAATIFMATLVTAFSLFTDALRDALDPKVAMSNLVSVRDLHVSFRLGKHKIADRGAWHQLRCSGEFNRCLGRRIRPAKRLGDGHRAIAARERDHRPDQPDRVQRPQRFDRIG